MFVDFMASTVWWIKCIYAVLHTVCSLGDEVFVWPVPNGDSKIGGRNDLQTSAMVLQLRWALSLARNLESNRMLGENFVRPSLLSSTLPIPCPKNSSIRNFVIWAGHVPS